MFAPPFRHSPEGCKPYMQMFPQIGYKSESKLLDIRLRLDMMTANEVRWMPYRTQDALWLEAPSHLLTKTRTSVPAILASSCTDDYLDWYLLRTHPRIQNPGNIPNGYNIPVAPAMPPQTLLDMIARKCHRQDISGDEFRHRVRDLLRVHYKAL
ncbi:hypothetical protein M9H77_07068 [Catharanthus roseus]|uniref:Uncharacterized protein n=2 Tax=Catharanthus roseus TaxID=4058 RepID=A0ACC0BTV5_CATRO|nr:hypothetical protein M9H77_07064 [Catharanthus roseus]KAI5676118.1 hypothetical protein M9H77_07068 [Catharanthus roseus]